MAVIKFFHQVSIERVIMENEAKMKRIAEIASKEPPTRRYAARRELAAIEEINQRLHRLVRTEAHHELP